MTLSYKAEYFGIKLLYLTFWGGETHQRALLDFFFHIAENRLKIL